jgi:hypothetical protein
MSRRSAVVSYVLHRAQDAAELRVKHAEWQERRRCMPQALVPGGAWPS